MADPTPVELPFEYTLEMVRGQSTSPERVVVIPNVSGFYPSPQPSDVRIWTLDLNARPIKHSAGIVEQAWRFEGHSGEDERTVTSIDTKSGQTVRTAGGVELFHEFLDFLAFYEAEKKKYQSAYSQDSARRPSMIIRALREGWAYYCDEIFIDPRRVVGTSRFSWAYSTTLKTEGEAKDRRPRDLVNDPARSLAASEKALAATLTINNQANRERAALIQSGVSKTQASAQAARGVIDTPIGRLLTQIPAELSAFKAPVERFAYQVAEIASQAATAIEAGAGFPRSLAANLASYAEQTIAAVTRIWDAMSDPLRDVGLGVLRRLRGPIRALQNAAQRLLGAAHAKRERPESGQVSTASSALTVQSIQGQAARLVRLAPGQTIADLAERYLGDRERWGEIKDLNGFKSSWLDADGRSLGAGSPIWVPIEGPALAAEASQSELYGTDFAWDFKRQDLVAEAIGFGTPSDFGAVSGAANLRQGIVTRATTPQGSVRVFPEMGISAMIGSNATDTSAAWLASQTRTQFGREDRIKRVKSTRLWRLANVTSVSLETESVGGEALTISKIGAPEGS